MKWSTVFFGSSLLFALSLPGVLISKLIWHDAVPDALFAVPILTMILCFVARKPALQAQTRAVRNGLRDFLERDALPATADLCDYPPDYVRKIEEASEELREAGMVFEADCNQPAEEITVSAGKVFGRVLRTRDGTVWAVVKRLRPNIVFRLVLTLLGMRRNFRTITEFSVFFDDGSLMGAINGKLSLQKPIPGFSLSSFPGMPPAELLQKCIEMKNARENDNPPRKALSLDYAAFSRLGLTNELYLSFQNVNLPFPSEEELEQEGFSPAAIEKYRQICLKKPPVISRSQENVSPATATATGTSPDSPPIQPPAEPAMPSGEEWDAALCAYAKSVTNLGAAVLLSAVNVILISTNSDISFPFSAFFPSLMSIVGTTAIDSGMPQIVATVCLAFAIASVALLALCWILAKKYRCFILISFLLFLFDTILLIPFIPEGGGSIWVEVVFHVWVLWTLFAGVKAWRSLKRQQPLMPEATLGRDGKAVKGCLIGCAGLVGIVVILLVTLLGIGITVIPPPVKFADIPLSAAENTELTQAFTRLDKALAEKAPGLQVKRKPLESAQRIQLGNATRMKKIEALYMWHEFVSGLEDCELIPGAKVAGVEFAIDLRNMSDKPLLRMTSPRRAKAMILLHDDAGDGYFLNITPEQTGVFYDMLETPGDDAPIGSLAHFVNLIADAIEQGMWSYDQNEKLVCDEAAFKQFQNKMHPKTKDAPVPTPEAAP
ncbi:MAG: hypothetical protein V8T90_05075 [Victivallales bacterium]